ncbi:hypothetical protein BGZ79_001540, partial [Entomortierella chlamydospora]
MALSSTSSAPSRNTRASSRASSRTDSAALSKSSTNGSSESATSKRSPGGKNNSTMTKTKTKAKAKAKAKATKEIPTKATKRRAITSGVSLRKRAKKQVSEDEEEENDQSEDADDDDDEDQDDYQEQDNDDDDDDDDEQEDSDADDFQDSSFTLKSKSRAQSSAKSTKKTPPTTKVLTPKTKKTTANPDFLPASTKKFLESPLKIPHPKGGPVADAIQPETLEFIRDLKLNNDREYMMLNQARCDDAKRDFLDFIRMVKEGLREADPDVMDQEPKDSMMRIYRDIRFSNDKRPYKNKLACHFSRGGRKSIAAGYYLGVSSGGETFVGCGVWDPSGPVLTRIRQGLVNHSDRFKAILETDAIKQVTGGKTGVDALRPDPSSLKTGPVGFDKNHPMIEFLKRKCFAIGRSFDDKQV